MIQNHRERLQRAFAQARQRLTEAMAADVLAMSRKRKAASAAAGPKEARRTHRGRKECS